MGWICPECSTTNNDAVAKCLCGYEAVGVEEKIEPAVRQSSHDRKRPVRVATYTALLILATVATIAVGLFSFRNSTRTTAPSLLTSKGLQKIISECDVNQVPAGAKAHGVTLGPYDPQEPTKFPISLYTTKEAAAPLTQDFLFCAGLRHTIKGSLPNAGLLIVSDGEAPLVFKVEENGYRYIQGKGVAFSESGVSIFGYPTGQSQDIIASILGKLPWRRKGYDRAEVLLVEALRYYELRDNLRAVAAFDQVPRDCRQFAVAMAFKGKALREMGKANESFFSYQAAVSNGGMLGIALTSLDRQAMKNGSAEDNQDIQKTVAFEPKDYWDHIGHARASRLLGSNGRAKAYYSSAIALDPLSAIAYRELAELADSSHDFDTALIMYSRALKANPQSVRALDGRALTFSQMALHDYALKDLDAAIRLSPDNGYLYGLRGAVFSYERKVDQATEDLSKAISLGNDSAIDYANLGSVYIDKDLDKAIANLSKAIEIDPRLAYAYNERGIAYERKGDATSARRDLRMAASLQKQKTGKVDGSIK